jgi:uncharacterized protein (DUF427 family)
MWTEILMARATWNGVVLAETDNPVLLEGNVYFPLARKIRNHVAFWNGVQVELATGSQDQAKAGN